MLLCILVFTAFTTAQQQPFQAKHGTLTTSIERPFALISSRQSVCPNTQKTCDTHYCMPSNATCCYDGIGSYCKSGHSCTSTGCCVIGEPCGPGSGGVVVCNSNEEPCGEYCMPSDSICCSATLGMYCDSDYTCTSDHKCSPKAPEVTACPMSRRGTGGAGRPGTGGLCDDDSDETTKGEDDSAANRVISTRVIFFVMAVGFLLS